MFFRGLALVAFSRAVGYHDARMLKHTTDQASGAQVRDVVKGIAKYGICSDAEFPYNWR